MWSSGQSSWLQIQGSGYDSRHYQIFWEVVGLELGLLSLVSTIEELLGRKSSCSSLENREYGRRNSSRWPRGTLYSQKLVLTSQTSGSSIGIVRSRAQATQRFTYKLLLNIRQAIHAYQECFCKSHVCLGITHFRLHAKGERPWPNLTMPQRYPRLNEGTGNLISYSPRSDRDLNKGLLCHINVIIPH
jgi:hypothetical protein